MQDGWQTSLHAKKARKWDVLAQEKMKLKQLIDDEKSNAIGALWVSKV